MKHGALALVLEEGSDARVDRGPQASAEGCDLMAAAIGEGRERDHMVEETMGMRYVAVGDVVAGKYLVESVLGSGGMAFVLSARHIELDEQFALKFLSRELVSDPVVVERFMREARAACRIRSEHVARAYDVGTHDGAPFMVMEHLRGRDLSAALEAGPLAVHDAVEYTLQACEALAAAHAIGVIHRDIKPENLFLVAGRQRGTRCVKLLDFGISKVALTGAAEATRLTGYLSIGTPSYMSPEQIRSSASADAQSDVWSLGVVLYELLTGTPPFAGETVTEVCAAVLEDAPCLVDVLRPEVPRELADVVARAMEKDRTRRYASMAELASALAAFASPHAQAEVERWSLTPVVRAVGNELLPPPSAPIAFALAPRPTSEGSSLPPSARDVQRRAERSHGVLAFFGAVVMMAVVGGGAWYASDGVATGSPVRAHASTNDARAPRVARETTCARHQAVAPSGSTASRGPRASGGGARSTTARPRIDLGY